MGIDYSLLSASSQNICNIHASFISPMLLRFQDFLIGYHISAIKSSIPHDTGAEETGGQPDTPGVLLL